MHVRTHHRTRTKKKLTAGHRGLRLENSPQGEVQWLLTWAATYHTLQQGHSHLPHSPTGGTERKGRVRLKEINTDNPVVYPTTTTISSFLLFICLESRPPRHFLLFPVHLPHVESLCQVMCCVAVWSISDNHTHTHRKVKAVIAPKSQFIQEQQTPLREAVAKVYNNRVRVIRKGTFLLEENPLG